MIETVPSRLKINILMAVGFFSKGHLDECSAFTSAKGRYDRGRLRRKDKGGMAVVKYTEETQGRFGRGQIPRKDKGGMVVAEYGGRTKGGMAVAEYGGRTRAVWAWPSTEEGQGRYGRDQVQRKNKGGLAE